jgi:hypothetical protein
MNGYGGIPGTKSLMIKTSIELFCEKTLKLLFSNNDNTLDFMFFATNI